MNENFAIPDSFIFAATNFSKSKTNLSMNENLHIPWQFYCCPEQTSLKSKRLIMNENLHTSDSFIIAVNRLLKSKTNLSWIIINKESVFDVITDLSVIRCWWTWNMIHFEQ
jgi:hypothetical protein